MIYSDIDLYMEINRFKEMLETNIYNVPHDQAKLLKNELEEFKDISDYAMKQIDKYYGLK